MTTDGEIPVILSCDATIVSIELSTDHLVASMQSTSRDELKRVFRSCDDSRIQSVRQSNT